MQAKLNPNLNLACVNHLYFGDCLEVLKELSSHQPPFIDLIYIDPPFNSKRNYNVLFESIDMKDANAQKQAFADTWSNVSYIVELGNIANLNKDLFDFLSMLEKSKSVNDSAVAYLTTMGIRICYMRKLLKDTGSFYLHCDPTMSHYLKLICDMIFDNKNFINEISWKRSGRTSSINKIYRKAHDIILVYTKTPKYIFNSQYEKHDEKLLNKYSQVDKRGKYQLVPLMASGTTKGETGKPWRGFDPNTRGKEGMHWLTTHDKLEEYVKKGLVFFPTKEGATPRLKYYLDQNKGVTISDFWDDIDLINSMGNESLGYPTQKPVALMERIIQASTKEGDVVADFFCGCGTTIAAAKKLNRQWLGADISHLAIKLIIQRLIKSYGVSIRDNIVLHGFPKDVDSAKMLARETENGRFGYQEWAIEVLLHGVVNVKKSADGGYDGYLTYNTDKGKDFVLIETKSGHVNVKNVREFIQVIDKQKAAAGIFVCFKDEVTKEMLKEAKASGKIKISDHQTDIDKIQILTIDELLSGKMPHLPNVISTFKQAERVEVKSKVPTLF